MKSFFTILFLLFSVNLFAQMAGPTQPEVQSFQPASISGLVEPSTGQFHYSIPLFEIGGYPMNLFYSANIGMEDEASMVGLGWNLTPGMLTRNVRGIPDDFNRDEMSKETSMRQNHTWGATTGFELEFGGIETGYINAESSIGVNSKIGVFWNNIKGWGIERSVGMGIRGNIAGLKVNAGIGVNSNSQHGTSVNPYAGISPILDNNQMVLKQSEKNDKEKHVVRKQLKLTPPGASKSLFNPSSYSPNFNLPFYTNNQTFQFKAGYGQFFTNAGIEGGVYHIAQKLGEGGTAKSLNPAFGYLYAKNGKNVPDAIMDFQRENDGVFTKDKPLLPMAIGSPDVYVVNTQGYNGSFELFRNNIFVAFDNQVKTPFSNNVGIEGEVGIGVAAFHAGAKLTYGFTDNQSGKWVNSLSNKMDFQTPSTNTDFEETYFKNPNDVMFGEADFYNEVETTYNQPIQITNLVPGDLFNQVKNMNGGALTNYFSQFNLGLDRNLADNSPKKKRLDVLSYLTADIAKVRALEPKIKSYTLNSLSGNIIEEDRVGGNRKEKHYSEFSILKADGSNYIFGIPCYNNTTISYSASTTRQQLVNGQIINPVDVDATKDKYQSKEITPAYAHAFLLTSFLGSDYVDVDNNGPSDLDFGTWVKFNYTKVYDSFNWQTPSQQKVNFNKGLESDKNDNKISYEKGTKEIWYTHSIESKNEVAHFKYSDREDVVDDTGKKLQRLESIKIYVKSATTSSEPILKLVKTINFDYDYTLCQGGATNGSLGKLTLKKVSIKNQESNKGLYSPYEFTYSSTNPNYDPKKIDRWGTYKPNNSNLDNLDFPYAEQQKNKADENSSAWLLSKITLPTGGIIGIDYEAASYSYVQDKRAMKMTQLGGIANKDDIANNRLSAKIEKNVLYDDKSSNNVLLFKLEYPLSGSQTEATDKLINTYLQDLKDASGGTIIGSGNLRGQMSIKLNDELGMETLPVYLNVLNAGVFKTSQSANFDYAYLEVSGESFNDSGNEKANAISKVGWDIIKSHHPAVLFGIEDGDIGDDEIGLETAKLFVEQLSLAIPNIIETIKQIGPYKKLRNMKTAQEIDLAKSFIRLYAPNSTKYGGGNRVKRIRISDQWGEMTGLTGLTGNYSLDYDYSMDVNGSKISSGVAAYEPAFGREENPWIQPVLYQENNGLMPDTDKFLEGPIGESLFPSPQIIYSEVKVTTNQIDEVERKGFQRYNYFTYYDKPVSSKALGKPFSLSVPKVNFSLLASFAFETFTAKQDFMIYSNNIHGKPKFEAVYGNSGELISSKKYFYKDFQKEIPIEKFALGKDGNSVSSPVGFNFQMYADTRTARTWGASGDLQGNYDFQQIGLIPVMTYSLIPKLSLEYKEFNSFTTTRFVHQQVILDSVMVTEYGSSIKTENLVWDKETGEVLLTKTSNEFKDPIYNLKLPAHWAYSEMDMAYNRWGLNGNDRPNWQQPLAPLQTVISLNNPIVNSSLKLDVNTKILDAKAYEYGRQMKVNCQTCFNEPRFFRYGVALDESQRSIDLTEVVSNNNKLYPLATYSFLTERNGLSTPNESVRSLGSYQNFSSYWNYNNASGTWDVRPTKWISTAKVTMTNGDGQAIEAVNPLNIFSSSQIGKKGFVHLSQVNSKYKHGIHDDFEELNERYSFLKATLTDDLLNKTDVFLNCPTFSYPILFYEQSFRNSMPENPVSNTLFDFQNAHSGKSSLRAFKELTFSSSKPCEENINNSLLRTTGKSSTNYSDNSKCKCLPQFELAPNTSYLFTAWVRDFGYQTKFEQFDGKITLDLNNQPFEFKPSGIIVDGWQQIRAEFKTPISPEPYLPFRLTYHAGAFYDDVRIHPLDASMKSYVYDFDYNRLSAILDENNFATFYEYDEEGNLRRTKKETELGIVTLQEVFSGTQKK